MFCELRLSQGIWFGKKPKDLVPPGPPLEVGFSARGQKSKGKNFNLPQLLLMLFGLLGFCVV